MYDDNPLNEADQTPEIWSPPALDSAATDEPDDGRNGPAWEWRHELGLWRALLLTLREVLLSPGECFRVARREGGLSRPLAFDIVMNLLFFITFLGFIILLYLAAPSMAAARYPQIFNATWFETLTQNSQAVNLIAGVVVFWIMVLFLSIFIAIKVLVLAAVFHVFLLMFGGARHGYEATFRTTAYVDGATTVLNLIPWFGKILGGIVFLVETIIGLKNIHETQTWKCVLAVLVPTVLFFMLIAVLAAFVIMAVYHGSLSEILMEPGGF